MPEIATYQVRGIFIRYAIDHFGWARKDAADAFDQWLEQRREVAMTTIVHTAESANSGDAR